MVKKVLKKAGKPASKTAVKAARKKKDTFTSVSKMLAKKAAPKKVAPVKRAVKPKAFKAPPTTAEYNATVDRAPKAPKPEPVTFFRVTDLVVSASGVFGLGSDNNVYRWDTTTAAWKLHKEGL